MEHVALWLTPLGTQKERILQEDIGCELNNRAEVVVELGTECMILLEFVILSRS